MTFDANEIKEILTDSQRQCVRDLSDDWKSGGYSSVDADILYALGGTDLYGRYGPIVDCTYVQEDGRYPQYRHKLLPLGVEVKDLLQ